MPHFTSHQQGTEVLISLIPLMKEDKNHLLQETHSPMRESEDQTTVVQCGRCGDGVTHENSLGTIEGG